LKKLGFIGVATAIVVAVLAATPAYANDSVKSARRTARQIAAMTQADQSAYLGPLRAAADGLEDAGRSVDPATFAGVTLNGPDRTVDLYLTDVRRADSFTAAAHAHKSFDGSIVRIHSAPYSHAQLSAARVKILVAGPSFSFAINQIALAVDGTGLEVGVAGFDGTKLGSAQESAAGDQMRTAAGVPVTVTYALPATNTSRAADGSPYYAGGFIEIHNSNGNYEDCSTGLAGHNNNGSYYVTAAHCGHTGDNVYNGDGAIEGRVIDYNTTYDAALVDARAAQLEFDGGQWDYNIYGYYGAAYSHIGDYVCQDGWTSGIVCSIHVTRVGVWTSHSGGNYPWTTSYGAMGQNDNGGAVTQPGDSGALVFACVNGCSSRQARGLVLGTTNGSDLFFTEAPDILNTFGLTMY
jgi:hypothetical protein